MLTDQARGEAGEAQFTRLQLVGGIDRHQLGAWLAVDVHEDGQDEADVVRERTVAKRLRRGGQSDDVTPGECGKGHSDLLSCVDCE